MNTEIWPAIDQHPVPAWSTAEFPSSEPCEDLLPDDPKGPRFHLLGLLQVIHNGVGHGPTAPKIRQLLAMLLLRPNRVVEVDTIAHELWADQPPRSARTTIQTYVYQLRRMFERSGLAANGDEMLLTRTPGYLLRVDPERIDVVIFRRLLQQGREHLRNEQYDQAAAVLRRALALWSGPPLADVDCGPYLSAQVLDLMEQRRNAHHLRIEADIAIGLHRELVGELRSLVATNPFDEGLHAQLIRVLERSGRRNDALVAYRNLRATLNRELGLEPCAELQRLHRELLSVG